ncbi:MAG: CRISPR-associated endonuclease Cas2 [Candidatus Uhrbacteria bacterium]
MSDTKEFFLDMLHLFGVFLTSGYSIPPAYICDRERYYEFMREQENYKVWRQSRELEKRKYIEIREKGDFVFFELKRKGYLEALKQQVLHTTDELPDDLVCLVSFDIPENVKKVRNVFRDFLKKAGFEQVHLSVWQSRLNVIEKLAEYVRCMGIEKWVQIYKAERISQSHTNLLFNL